MDVAPTVGKHRLGRARYRLMTASLLAGMKSQGKDTDSIMGIMPEVLGQIATDTREAARLLPGSYRAQGFAASIELLGITSSREDEPDVKPMKEILARLETLTQPMSHITARPTEVFASLLVFVGRDHERLLSMCRFLATLEPEREEHWKRWLMATCGIMRSR